MYNWLSQWYKNKNKKKKKKRKSVLEKKSLVNY